MFNISPRCVLRTVRRLHSGNSNVCLLDVEVNNKHPGTSILKNPKPTNPDSKKA